MMRLWRLPTIALVVLLVAIAAPAWAADDGDPLPSWNEGAAKQAVVAMVKGTTDQGSPTFVPPAERIATFDNDGTLWVEQPMYTQVVFAFDRVKALAPSHPDWDTKEPFRSVLLGDRETMARFTSTEFEQVFAETHGGMTVEAFQALAKQWLATARHPRFKRPYTELVYQPMLEVLRYLRANGYKTYIVTGGGQDFVRVFADQVYGIPPEQVVGSAGNARFEYDKVGKPELVKLPSTMFIDDHGGKPVGINLVIGRRPHAAVGNSTGDREMLEWTQAGAGSRLMMLVHHDDAQREYDYGANSRVGTFSDALMAEAKKRGWSVISIKNDWNRVFPFDPPAKNK
jgi:phosphoglycolate phosphatase-like HAD superfamily hydrolase